ncbi:MAG: BofC C-terminal domain-containing protein [Limnochordia bacterium]
MQRRLFALLAAAAFLGGFAYSYAKREGRPAVKSDRPDLVRLNERALVTMQYMLADGRRAGLEHAEADLIGFTGASYDDLSQAHPAWNILRFNTDELVVEVRCEAHTGGYIGERDGYVAVFDGAPGPCSVLRELTKIPVSKLPPGEQEYLRQGRLTFADDNVMQELLDGLMGDG